MMSFLKVKILFLAIVIGLAAVILTLTLVGKTPTVVALELAGTESIYPDPLYQPPPPNDDDLQFIAFFTDEVPIQITDLSGMVIGEATHQGEIRCNRNKCSQQINLSFGFPFTDPIEYEYKFTTRQAINPEEERVVVSGKGVVSSRGQKERFSFIATFQNNRDGTVWIRYEASRPDASFIVPRASGTFEIFSKP